MMIAAKMLTRAIKTLQGQEQAPHTSSATAEVIRLLALQSEKISYGKNKRNNWLGKNCLTIKIHTFNLVRIWGVTRKANTFTSSRFLLQAEL